MEGVYAAWITTREALMEVGIDGPPPVLLYIGKATGVEGLRTRLRRHVSCAWWELIDLLASRRTVLPGWWSHSQKNTERRTLLIPPLAMVSHDQALDWQHRNLRWGWVPASDASALEVALIAEHRPLLNRLGRGCKSQPMMQLQKVGSYERERAWRLFHVSWLAVLTLRPEGWIQRWSRRRPWLPTDHVACDENGWPVPLLAGESQALTIPDEWSARDVLIDAASHDLREVVADHGSSADQSIAWWAAYAGHPFLQSGQSHEDALCAAFARSDEAYQGPPELPSGRALSELLGVVGGLPLVTH